jgi:hypothetical protein
MGMNFSIFRIPGSDFDWFKNANDEAVRGKIEDPDLPRDRIFETEIVHKELHYVLTGTESAGRGPRSLIMNQYGEPMKYKCSYGPGRLLSPKSVQELQVEISRYLTPDVVAERIKTFDKEERRDIKEAFKEFCSFVSAAVEAGDALMTIWS